MRDIIDKKDMKAFCHLTDDVIVQILRSTDEGLNVSKKIIESVLNRKLYAFVGEVRFSYGRYKDEVSSSL